MLEPADQMDGQRDSGSNPHSLPAVAETHSSRRSSASAASTGTQHYQEDPLLFLKSRSTQTPSTASCSSMFSSAFPCRHRLSHMLASDCYRYSNNCAGSSQHIPNYTINGNQAEHISECGSNLSSIVLSSYPSPPPTGSEPKRSVPLPPSEYGNHPATPVVVSFTPSSMLMSSYGPLSPPPTQIVMTRLLPEIDFTADRMREPRVPVQQTTSQLLTSSESPVADITPPRVSDLKFDSDDPSAGCRMGPAGPSPQQQSQLLSPLSPEWVSNESVHEDAQNTQTWAGESALDSPKSETKADAFYLSPSTSTCLFEVPASTRPVLPLLAIPDHELEQHRHTPNSVNSNMHSPMSSGEHQLQDFSFHRPLDFDELFNETEEQQEEPLVRNTDQRSEIPVFGGFDGQGFFESPPRSPSLHPLFPFVGEDSDNTATPTAPGSPVFDDEQETLVGSSSPSLHSVSSSPTDDEDDEPRLKFFGESDHEYEYMREPYGYPSHSYFDEEDDDDDMPFGLRSPHSPSLRSFSSLPDMDVDENESSRVPSKSPSPRRNRSGSSSADQSPTPSLISLPGAEVDDDLMDMMMSDDGEDLFSDDMQVDDLSDCHSTSSTDTTDASDLERSPSSLLLGDLPPDSTKPNSIDEINNTIHILETLISSSNSQLDDCELKQLATLWRQTQAEERLLKSVELSLPVHMRGDTRRARKARKELGREIGVLLKIKSGARDAGKEKEKESLGASCNFEMDTNTNFVDVPPPSFLDNVSSTPGNAKPKAKLIKDGTSIAKASAVSSMAHLVARMFFRRRETHRPLANRRMGEGEGYRRSGLSIISRPLDFQDDYVYEEDEHNTVMADSPTVVVE